MADIKVVKGKFNKLQDEVNQLKNDKVGIESEVKTLKESMDEEIAELLKLTGKATLKEAKEYYDQRKVELESKTNKLEEELDNYLDKDKDISDLESGSNNLVGDTLKDFDEFDV